MTVFHIHASYFIEKELLANGNTDVIGKRNKPNHEAVYLVRKCLLLRNMPKPWGSGYKGPVQKQIGVVQHSTVHFDRNCSDKNWQSSTRGVFDFFPTRLQNCQPGQKKLSPLWRGQEHRFKKGTPQQGLCFDRVQEICSNTGRAGLINFRLRPPKWTPGISNYLITTIRWRINLSQNTDSTTGTRISTSKRTAKGRRFTASLSQEN